MTDYLNIAKGAANQIRSSITLKTVSIGILILLLLIPAAMIQNLISERQYRRNSVVEEISQKWSAPQTITGPFISVPIKSFFMDHNGKMQFNLNHLHILPETLEITGEIKPEMRYRSLYEAVLYNTRLKFSGSFKLPPTSQLDIDPSSILWDKAYLSLGVSDMRGIQDKVVIDFNNTTYDANPGLKTTDLAAAGVSTLIKPLLPDEDNKFSFSLN